MNAYYMRISQVLTDSVSLSLPPIAISFASPMPEGIRNWTGRVPAGYRFWQEAAKEAFATVPTDHDLCGIGTFTHNLETTEAHDADRRDALKVQRSGLRPRTRYCLHPRPEIATIARGLRTSGGNAGTA